MATAVNVENAHIFAWRVGNNRTLPGGELCSHSGVRQSSELVQMVEPLSDFAGFLGQETVDV